MGAPRWPPYPQRSERPGKPVPLSNLDGGPEMAPIPPTLGAARETRAALQLRWGPRDGPHTPDARSGPGNPCRSSISVWPARPSVSTVRHLISTARLMAVDGARGAPHGEREPDTCRPGRVADGLSGCRRPREQD